jgi:hypothetical protein
LLRRLVWWMFTDVSEVLAATIRAKRRPTDGDSKHLWNVGKLLSDYTAQQPRRQPSFRRKDDHKYEVCYNLASQSCIRLELGGKVDKVSVARITSNWSKFEPGTYLPNASQDRNHYTS